MKKYWQTIIPTFDNTGFIYSGFFKDKKEAVKKAKFWDGVIAVEEVLVGVKKYLIFSEKPIKRGRGHEN